MDSNFIDFSPKLSSMTLYVLEMPGKMMASFESRCGTKIVQNLLSIILSENLFVLMKNKLT